ncbi:MAG: hypothetical protein IJF84_09500 [Thermoguttaceae bacterium]|nr:hypothetical protein [Thermoguttaceae bacterium]
MNRRTFFPSGAATQRLTSLDSNVNFSVRFSSAFFALGTITWISTNSSSVSEYGMNFPNANGLFASSRSHGELSITPLLSESILNSSP